MRQPEFSDVLANAALISASTDRLVAAVEALPAERQAAIEQIAAVLRAEREAFLRTLFEEEARLRGLLSELRETLQVGAQLASTVNGGIAATEQLAVRLGLDQPKAAGEPLSPAEVRLIVSDISRTAENYTRLLAEANTLIGSPAWDQRIPQAMDLVNQVDRDVEQLMWEIYAMNAGLILIFFLGLFVYRYAASRAAISRRRPAPSDGPGKHG